MDIVARWLGSVHYSAIFNDLLLSALFENGNFEADYLLCDKEYPCERDLLI